MKGVSTVDYTWNTLSSREFEVIACNYAADMFPDKKWYLTKSTGDGNRDFESYPEIDRLIKWGEAKHSKNPQKQITKGQLDPTMMSAKLINSVNEIVIVTCADISLNYVARSCSYIEAPITQIYYINRLVLNQWYEKKGKDSLKDYDKKYRVNKIKKKLQPCEESYEFGFKKRLYIYDETNGNHLTEVTKIETGNLYSCMIVTFNPSDTIPLSLSFQSDIIVVDNQSLNLRSMSSNIQDKTASLYKDQICFEAPNGYSVLQFNFLARNSTKRSVEISLFSDSKNIIKKRIKYKQKESLSEDDYQEIQDWIYDHTSKANRRKEFNVSISPSKIKDQTHTLICEVFDERQGYNYSKLCRFLTHLVLSVDLRRFNETMLKEHIYVADYTDGVEGLILSAYTDSFKEDIEEYALNIYNNSFSEEYNFSQKTIYCLYDTAMLDEDNRKFFNRILKIYDNRNDENTLILFQYPKSNQQMQISPDVCLVYMFDSGINKSDLELSESEHSTYVQKGAFDNLIYPDQSLSMGQIRRSFDDFNEDEKEYLYEKIIKLAKKYTISTGITEFFSAFVVDYDIESDKKLCVFLRALRDELYDKTDFYGSYKITKILKKLSRSSEEEFLDTYKEADELNHCGLMSESLNLFSSLSNADIPETNTICYPKMIEARTEVFNLRYWTLDVSGLIDDIIECIPLAKKLSQEKGLRNSYSYYNCLNRKMVTELLVEDYNSASKTYKMYLKECDKRNYLAFAHMDYARGLYRKDIDNAFELLKIAKEILADLYSRGEEKRRYLDCKCEYAYVGFIISKERYRNQRLKALKAAIIDIRKAGYRSMAFKCYYKLAACYLVMNDESNARKMLDNIKYSPRLNQSKRHILMYHHLESGYHMLKMINENKGLKAYNCFPDHIDFAREDSYNSDCIYLDPRLW